MELGISHLLLSMLTLNFKILHKILLSEIVGGVNHLLLFMLTLNFKIVSKTLVSDTWVGGQSSFFVHANSLTLKFYLRLWPVKLGGGGICQQKYPNLCIRKLSGGNLLAEIPKSSSRLTKSASKEIAWGESAGRNTQIC